MGIEKFDDTKMRECLRAVKSCLDGLTPKGMLLRQLKKIYDEQMTVDGLTLSSGIDFCLDTTNTEKQRNWQFNYIFLEVDTLLMKMKELLDRETRLKMNRFHKDAIKTHVFFDDGDMKTTYSHIKTTDDLLQVVVADMQSRKKAQEKEADIQSRKKSQEKETGMEIEQFDRLLSGHE